MKRRFTRQRHLIGLAVVVLVATCFGFGSSSLKPAPARALLQVGKFKLKDYHFEKRTLGMVPGQVGRVSIANLADTRSAGSLTFHVKAFAPDGTLVFETERREVPLRGLGYEDIPYDNLGALVGEPRTERKQFLVEVSVEAPRGAKSSDLLIGSVEVYDEETGETAYNWGYAILPFIEQDPIF